MKRLSVIFAYFLLFSGAGKLWAMEKPSIEAVAMQIPTLVELAIKPAAEAIFAFATKPTAIYNAIKYFPVNLRVPLAYTIIQDVRYPGTDYDKLALAYQVSVGAPRGQIQQLDALFDAVIKDIDPCDFVRKKLEALLPGYTHNQFSLRDERLIKAILRKPGLGPLVETIQKPAVTLQSSVAVTTNYALSPDGTMIAFGIGNHTLCIWHVSQNKPVALFNIQPNLGILRFGLGWSPDSATLAVGLENGMVQLYRVADVPGPTIKVIVDGLSPTFIPLGQDDRIQQIFFNRQEGKLNEEQRNIIRNIFLQEPREALEQQNMLQILSIAEPDHKARTWFIECTQEVKPSAQLNAHNGPVHTLVFSPDGNFLAILTEGHHVSVWDLKGRVITSIFAQNINGNPVALALSNQATRLAVAPSEKKILIFDVALGAQIAAIDTDSFQEGYQGLGANAIALSPDGNLVAYMYKGNYCLYDIAQQKNIVVFSRGYLGPMQVFSPTASFVGDGGFAASVDSLGDFTLTHVDALRFGGNLKVQLARQEYPSCFSADGAWLATWRVRLNLWRLPQGYLLGNLNWKQLQERLSTLCKEKK